VSITCACHSLNLCGETAARVSSFQDAFTHLTAVVAFFAHPKRGEIMDRKLGELRLPVRRFIVAAPTRWNYTAQVVQRSIENSPAVTQLTCADLDIQGTKEKEEWNQMRTAFDSSVQAVKALLPLLQRLDKAMQVLSSCTKATVSRLFPQALTLWELADTLCKSDSIVTREFAAKFRDEVNARFYTGNSDSLRMLRVAGSRGCASQNEGRRIN
jgi:hypothetical protein